MAGDEGLAPAPEIHLVPTGTGELRQVLVADPVIQGEFTLIYRLSLKDGESLTFPEMDAEPLLGILRSLILTLGSIGLNGEQVLSDEAMQLVHTDDPEDDRTDALDEGDFYDGGDGA